MWTGGTARQWDESKIRRHPRGTRRGGQFAPKYGEGSPFLPRQGAPRQAAPEFFSLVDPETGTYWSPEAVQRQRYKQRKIRQKFSEHRGRKRADLVYPDERQKDAIAHRLAERTGLEIDVVSNLVRDWAATSNGPDMGSGAIQKVAAALFRRRFSPYQEEKMGDAREFDPNSWIPFERALGRDQAKAKIAEILRDMKAETEAWFREIGMDPNSDQEHVVLYRGLGDLPYEYLDGLASGDVWEVEDNVLSSWSLSLDEAEKFARSENWATGVVLRAAIPIDRILCNARTGFGCLSEEEFLVIAAPNGATMAQVVEIVGGDDYDHDGDDYDDDDYDEDDDGLYSFIYDDDDGGDDGALESGGADVSEPLSQYEKDLKAWWSDMDSLWHSHWAKLHTAVSQASKAQQEQVRAWERAFFGQDEHGVPLNLDEPWRVRKLLPEFRAWIESVVPSFFYAAGHLEPLRPMPQPSDYPDEFPDLKAWGGRFDESKHRRHPKGTRRGGQFAPKYGEGSPLLPEGEGGPRSPRVEAGHDAGDGRTVEFDLESWRPFDLTGFPPPAGDLRWGLWQFVNRMASAGALFRVTGSQDGRPYFVKWPSPFDGDQRHWAEYAVGVLGAYLGLPVLPVQLMRAEAVLPDELDQRYGDDEVGETLVVSPWIEGVSAAELGQDDLLHNSLSDDMLARLALFDYVTGNGDRAPRNVMVAYPEGGKTAADVAAALQKRGTGDDLIRLIDHEYMFESSLFAMEDRTQLGVPSYFQMALVDRLPDAAVIDRDYLTWLEDGLRQAEPHFRTAAGAYADHWWDFMQAQVGRLREAFAVYGDDRGVRFGDLKAAINRQTGTGGATPRQAAPAADPFAAIPPERKAELAHLYDLRMDDVPFEEGAYWLSLQNVETQTRVGAMLARSLLDQRDRLGVATLRDAVQRFAGYGLDPKLGLSVWLPAFADEATVADVEAAIGEKLVPSGVIGKPGIGFAADIFYKLVRNTATQQGLDWDGILKLFDDQGIRANHPIAVTFIAEHAADFAGMDFATYARIMDDQRVLRDVPFSDRFRYAEEAARLAARDPAVASYAAFAETMHNLTWRYPVSETVKIFGAFKPVETEYLIHAAMEDRWDEAAVAALPERLRRQFDALTYDDVARYANSNLLWLHSDLAPALVKRLVANGGLTTPADIDRLGFAEVNGRLRMTSAGEMLADFLGLAAVEMDAPLTDVLRWMAAARAAKRDTAWLYDALWLATDGMEWREIRSALHAAGVRLRQLKEDDLVALMRYSEGHDQMIDVEAMEAASAVGFRPKALQRLGPVAARWQQTQAQTVDAATGALVAVPPQQAELERYFHNVHVGPESRYSGDGAQKDAICQTLSNRTGVDYDDVSDLLQAWTENSNDGLTAAAQEAATRVFGAKLSPWQLDYGGWFYDPDYDMDAMLRAMQAETRAWLQAAGNPTHVRLYRGATRLAAELAGVEVGDIAAYDDNALASWSLSPETAAIFAEREVYPGSGQSGFVLSALFPVDRILSTARTGFGCLREGEFVVIGSNEPSYGRVEAVYVADEPANVVDPDDPDFQDTAWEAWGEDDFDDAKAWNPLAHPRYPKGGREGGRFRPKWGAAGTPVRQDPPKVGTFTHKLPVLEQEEILQPFGVTLAQVESIFDEVVLQSDDITVHYTAKGDGWLDIDAVIARGRNQAKPLGMVTFSLFKPETPGQRSVLHLRGVALDPALREAVAGVGTRLVERLIALGRTWGMDEVRLSAGATIGRYAWAKLGFDYADPDHVQTITQRFVQWAKRKGIRQPAGGWPQFRHAQEVATYDLPGVRLRGRNVNNPDVHLQMDLAVGKAFMLDRGPDGHDVWEAVMHLTPPPPERDGARQAAPSVRDLSGYTRIEVQQMAERGEVTVDDVAAYYAAWDPTFTGASQPAAAALQFMRDRDYAITASLIRTRAHTMTFEQAVGALVDVYARHGLDTAPAVLGRVVPQQLALLTAFFSEGATLDALTRAGLDADLWPAFADAVRQHGAYSAAALAAMVHNTAQARGYTTWDQVQSLLDEYQLWNAGAVEGEIAYQNGLAYTGLTWQHFVQVATHATNRQFLDTAAQLYARQNEPPDRFAEFMAGVAVAIGGSGVPVTEAINTIHGHVAIPRLDLIRTVGGYKFFDWDIQRLDPELQEVVNSVTLDDLAALAGSGSVGEGAVSQALCHRAFDNFTGTVAELEARLMKRTDDGRYQPTALGNAIFLSRAEASNKFARMFERAGGGLDDLMRWVSDLPSVGGNRPFDALLHRLTENRPAGEILAALDAVGRHYGDLHPDYRYFLAKWADTKDLMPDEAYRWWSLNRFDPVLRWRLPVGPMRQEVESVDPATGKTVPVPATQAHMHAKLRDEHQGEPFEQFDLPEARQKAALADTLSKQVGGPWKDSEAVSNAIRGWAYSSQEDEGATAQIAANELYGTGLSEYQTNLLNMALDRSRWADPAAVAAMKDLLEAMRRNTAEWFKSTGATHVRLYRGVTVPMGQVEGLKIGDILRYKDNALASWSLSPHTAAGFGKAQYGPYMQPHAGLVLSAVFPVERILSTARTGFGCLDETEMVVIGRPEESYAQVEGVYRFTPHPKAA